MDGVPVRYGLVAVRRAPFTVLFLSVLWVLGLASGSVLRGPGDGWSDRVAIGVQPLAGGHWWTPLTSLLFCGDLAGYVLTTVLVVGVCLPAERRLGSWRTCATFVACHVIGGLVGVALVAAGSLAGEWWSMTVAAATAVGPSTGAAAVALTLTWSCSPLWRRRIRLVVLGTLVMLVLYSGGLQDVLRLVAGLVGLVLGRTVAGRRRVWRPVAVARPDSRLLLALLTAGSAIGPLIAVASGLAVGPLSLLRYVFLPSVPDSTRLTEACADPDRAMACHVEMGQEVLHRFAPAFASVIPVLILLVLAEGLRRGRRFAWWGAVVVNLALAAFGAVATEVVPSLLSALTRTPQSYGDLESIVVVFASASVPLMVVALLVANRRAFGVAAPAGTYRQLLGMIGVVLAVLSVVYVAGGWLVADQFRPVAGLGDLLRDLPTRFIPPGYLTAGRAPLNPVGPVAVLLHDWPAVVLWTAVLAGVWRTFRRGRILGGPADAARARGLLVRHGGSQLSYMTTWRGNQYWFAADGRVVVTYRLVGSVAITVGDPIGVPAGMPAALAGFVDFCALNGWTPCFYSVTEELGASLAGRGWRLLQVAEDTRLPLAQLAFTGRRWQDIRTALNRARREGMVARWHSYRHGPLEITAQIRAISAEWVLDKGVPEMGFTLGGLAELGDDAVRCLVALDGTGRVHAVTSWLPVYQSGEVIGWTLDMMRRRPDAHNGVMEFLIAKAALRLKDEGAQFVSLSGAPLARNGTHFDLSLPQRLLDRLGHALEPVYGFRSLLAFKAKFQPVYRPLLLAYPESAALPAIAYAIGRAYLPVLTARQALRLARLTLFGSGSRSRGAERARPPAAAAPVPRPHAESPVEPVLSGTRDGVG